jgi:membrane-bound ClpP family serine protease
MPYLEFFSITAFCEHLQASNIDEAFVCYDSKASEVSKLEFHKITFSARTGDYISVCSFELHREKETSIEKYEWLKQQVGLLLERLSRYGVVKVKEGRWLSDAPRSLAEGEFVGLLPTPP